MVSKEFIENVTAGDVIAVRNALVEYLIIDRTFQTFDEAFAYAAKRLPVLEVYDGEELESDEQKWNADYLNLQKASLRFNFSQERIDHLKQVIKAVMPLQKPEPVSTGVAQSGMSSSGSGRTGRKVVSETELTPVGSGRPAQQPQSASGASFRGTRKTGKRILSEQEIADSQKRKDTPAVDAGTVLIAGGAIVAITGVAIAEPVIAGVGALAVGAGCVMKISDHK